ncbi:hypothetical protein WME99_47950 [Sorangium sp. So ce136]|uniref:hypothetical protein n=1 Tax=Sorangium sp. So ce136 TaxID=3133284 RepID=UPI003F05D6E5
MLDLGADDIASGTDRQEGAIANNEDQSGGSQVELTPSCDADHNDQHRPEPLCLSADRGLQADT